MGLGVHGLVTPPPPSNRSWVFVNPLFFVWDRQGGPEQGVAGPPRGRRPPSATLPSPRWRVDREGKGGVAMPEPCSSTDGVAEDLMDQSAGHPCFRPGLRSCPRVPAGPARRWGQLLERLATPLHPPLGVQESVPVQSSSAPATETVLPADSPGRRIPQAPPSRPASDDETDGAAATPHAAPQRETGDLGACRIIRKPA